MTVTFSDTLGATQEQPRFRVEMVMDERYVMVIDSIKIGPAVRFKKLELRMAITESNFAEIFHATVKLLIALGEVAPDGEVACVTFEAGTVHTINPIPGGVN